MNLKNISISFILLICSSSFAQQSISLDSLHNDIGVVWTGDKAEAIYDRIKKTYNNEHAGQHPTISSYLIVQSDTIGCWKIPSAFITERVQHIVNGRTVTVQVRKPDPNAKGKVTCSSGVDENGEVYARGLPFPNSRIGVSNKPIKGN